MTALILQARLDSSRLPKKALLPLGGEPMILRVMENLKGAKADAYVLACPPDAESAFAPWPKEQALASCWAPKKMFFPAM
ncbi:hypothetical protein MASR2M78_27050 [Treponema sp.]